MRLKGAPPDGQPALSYINKPTGSLVGSADRPVGHLINVPGHKGDKGDKGDPGSTIAGVAGLQGILDAKAEDSAVVHKTGDETISGVKTFAGAVDLSGHKIRHLADATASDEAVNKGQLDLKQNLSEKGAANGYAGLDSGGKVPVSQLPSSLMEYQGVWDAATNTPTLADSSGTRDKGDVYRVSVGGTLNLGSGSITFDVGDYVIYNGTTWEKSDTTDAVASVAGKTGVVTLTTGDVPEDATSLYYTAARSALKADKARTISAGTGLTGGGDLSADRTLAVDFGSAAGKVCQGNDSRLSDTRTPTDGSVTRPKLATTGTPDGSKFLRDDMQWTALSSLATTVNLKGTFASRPAAGQDGRLYECTDVGRIYRDNGTSWETVWIGNIPPALIGDVPTSGWTPQNAGTTTWASNLDGMLMTVPSGMTTLAYQYRDYPTPPFTLTVHLEALMTGTIPISSGFFNGGIFMSDGTKFLGFGPGIQNSSTPPWAAYIWSVVGFSWTSATVAATPLKSWHPPETWIGQMPKWYRLADDGTNITLSFSINGVDWDTYYTGPRAGFLTPSRIGVGAFNSSTSAVALRVRSWKGVA